MNKKTKFSTIDYVILTYMLQSGITLFVLPRLVAENFGYNGWIAIPIISGFLLLLIILIGYTCKKMNRVSPLDIMDSALSKFFRYPLYILLIGVWAILGCSVGASYFQIIQMTSFPNTPQYIFKAILSVIAYFILASGFDSFVKGTVVFFFLTIWTLISSFFILQEFDLARLTPFIFAGETNYIDGTFEVIQAFLGFEIFILFSVYIQKDINITKAIVYGHLLVTSVYLFITFISFGFFSFNQLTEIQFPVLHMLDYVDVPFLERVDNLIFSFFFMKVMVTVIAYYWAAKETLKHMFTKVNEKVLILFIVAPCFLLGFKLETAREIDTIVSLFSKIALSIAIILPVSLLILLKFKPKKTNEVRNHG